MAERLGLIAGSGRFPVLVAEEARRKGVEVVALAIPGVTDPALEPKVFKIQYFKLGQIEAPLRYFKEHGVRKAVMAGKVQHASVFGGLMPDLRALKLFAGLKDRRPDTILSAVADEFSKEGIELLSSSAYLTHLMPSEGVLSRRAPTKEELADVELGWRAAKAVAGFDIGQAVVAQGGAIVAVEAMEGTDSAVARAGEIARSHGRKPRLVVVKVAKPCQDFRFDLPVLGLDTLPTLEKAGASVLALEAGKTLVFDKDEFIRRADALGLAVIVVSEESVAKGQRK
ncbi:MAG: UDP-2,3-diacylglucosamine diphosphatase LpxI [Elusimicrobia bacterium]|nr:UDP-2,3-diacylglucosamine diphosphatase LpxI [Elusimicrobiota bacterium]